MNFAFKLWRMSCRIGDEDGGEAAIRARESPERLAITVPTHGFQVERLYLGKLRIGSPKVVHYLGNLRRRPKD